MLLNAKFLVVSGSCHLQYQVISLYLHKLIRTIYNGKNGWLKDLNAIVNSVITRSKKAVKASKYTGYNLSTTPTQGYCSLVHQFGETYFMYIYLNICFILFSFSNCFCNIIAVSFVILLYVNSTIYQLRS